MDCASLLQQSLYFGNSNLQFQTHQAERTSEPALNGSFRNAVSATVFLMRTLLQSPPNFPPPHPPLLQSHHGFNAQINPVHHNYMDVCLYWSHISQARLTVSGKIKIDVWLPGRSWGTSTALWLSSSWVYKLLSVILMDLFPSFSRSLPLFLHITLYWFTGVCQQMAPM